MAGAREFKGEAEIFDGETSLGRAEYFLLDTSTARGKSANGILDFVEGPPRNFPTRPLTVRLDSGVSFQVVITAITNGRVSVGSHGPVPGL